MTLSPLEFSEFKHASKKVWRNEANTQLKTQESENELVWELIPGWKVPAYFDQNDAKGLGYLFDFFSKLQFDWQLIQAIVVENEKTANQEALEALNQGCTGVLFRCSNKVDFSKLTAKIHFEHCFVSFSISENEMSMTSDFMSSNRVDGFCHTNNGLELSSKESIIEIAEQLVKFSNNPTLSNVLIKVGGNFFFEIAKLRAFRYLIDRVASVLETSHKKQFWIHSEVEASELENHNILIQTSAGLSAIIGGTNSVSFKGNSGNDRIATNVGNLIRDEAKIHQFNDASAGSYFIDYITDKLIQEVWGQFQKMQS